MKVCVSCGAQMEDYMKFCGACGTPAPDPAEAAKDAVGDVNAQAGVIPQQTNAIPMPTNTSDASQNYGQTQSYDAGQNYGQTQQQDAGQNYGQTQQYDAGQTQQYDPNQQYQQQYQQQYNNFQQQGGAAAKAPNPLLVKVQKNPMLAVIPLAAIIVLIVIIVVIVNVTKYQKIDAQELFYFQFEGLNKYGTVTADLNDYSRPAYISESVSPYFSIDSDMEKKTWTKARNSEDIYKMRQALLKTNSKGKHLIKANMDKEKNLQNGDKINVTVEYDEDILKENKIKLINTEFEIEVKNLEEGIDFDPFDDKYLTVTFEGMDGEGRVSVNTTSDTPFNVWYDWDYSSSLSNGDKITVTAEVYNTTEIDKVSFYFESDGKYYVIKNKDALKKEYEVSGLTELQEIDVFENIAFEFDRGTPFLRVKGVDNDNMSKIVADNVNFYIENGDNLKVGDKFTVKAYSYSLKSEGYKIKGEVDADGNVTKDFVVDDSMPSYVTADNGKAAYDSADFRDIISDKETDIKTTLQDKSASWLWDATNVKYEGKVEKVESMVLKDVYVGFTTKNNYSNINSYVNRVYGLYEIKVRTDDEEEDSATLYAVIYIENVISHNGKFYQSSTWDNCKIYFYGAMADFNKEVVGKEGFTVTKCGGAASAGGSDDSKAEKTTTTTAAPEAEDSSAAEEDSEAEEETSAVDSSADDEEEPEEE